MTEEESPGVTIDNMTEEKEPTEIIINKVPPQEEESPETEPDDDKVADADDSPEITPIHSLSLTSHLWSLYKTKLGADVTVSCGGRQFELHYPVLSHGSNYFRKELSESKIIEIDFAPTLDPDIFETIVESLYTGIVRDINEINVTDILEASYKLEVPSAVETCSNFIMQHIGIDNCLKYWLAAKACDCGTAADFGEGLIGRHLQTVSKNLYFLQLELQTLLEILSDDNLQVPSEEVVYEAAMNWIKFEEQRKVHLNDVLTAVRLPLLSPKYLIQVVGDEDLVENDRGAMSKYSTALKAKLNVNTLASSTCKPRHSFMYALVGFLERSSKEQKALNFSC